MTKILKNIIKDNFDMGYFWGFLLIIFLAYTSKFDGTLFLGNFLLSIICVLMFLLISNRYATASLTTLIVLILLYYTADTKAELVASPLNISDIDFILNLRELAGEDLILAYLTKTFVIMSLLLGSLIFYHFKNSRMVIQIGKNIWEYLIKRAIMIVAAISIWKLTAIILSSHGDGINRWIDNTRNKNKEYCLAKKNIRAIDRAKCYSMGPLLDIANGLADPELSAAKFTEGSNYVKNELKKSNAKYANDVSSLPNVILVLNESTFNPQSLDYDFSEEIKFKFFNSDEIKHSGLLRVHTFGGGSSLSEFPSLTGVIHEVFEGPNSYPFINMAEITKESIFTELKKAGYYNVVVYPNNKNFLNAKKAFKMLGADKIVDISDYGHTPSDWRDVPESLLGEIIESEIEKAPKNTPVFVSVATIRNHGPHDKNYPDKIGCNGLIKGIACSKFNDYLNRLKQTDFEWENFTEKLKSRAAKFILIHFGDHLPSFEGEMDEFSFKKLNSLDTDLYATFYNVRSNLDLPDINYKLLDIAFIPSLILDYIGKNNSDYYRASSLVRDRCAGLLDDCNDKKLIQSFKSLMTEQLELTRK